MRYSGTDSPILSLTEAFTEETALSVAKLIVNEDGDWDFEAVGVGHVGGLETLIDIYAS